MRAYKCDKCGKLFDYSEDNGFITYSARSKSNPDTVMQEYDLCCNCNNDFLKFMNKKDSDSNSIFKKDSDSNSIFNERGKEMLRKIGADKETVTEGYLGKV